MLVNIVGDSLTLRQCNLLYKAGYLIQINAGKIAVKRKPRRGNNEKDKRENHTRFTGRHRQESPSPRPA